MGAKLTPRQELFCREYLVDLNATQAATRAGYSAKTALQQGPRLLGNVGVSARIEQLKAKRATKLEITADRVLLEMSRIALSDTRKLFDDAGRLRPVSEWDDDMAAAVAGVDVAEETEKRSGRHITTYTKKVKLWDKINALVKLGQHLGMFREQVTNLNVTPADLEGMSDADLDRLRAKLTGR
ncbi:MAG: terminase small subunit [Candidatus Nanopelagicales bacterium]|nr:terminase small subunit [Candidatus Nanopelagicales bacterium]